MFINILNVKKRWRNGNGYIKNIHFYRSIKKYGWENFEHNILAENVDEETAKTIEKELIKKYKTTNPKYGYNITRGGDTRQPCPEEVKEKIRQKNLGKIVSEETRKKISAAKKGKKRGPMPEEQKNKISKSLIGNKFALGKHNNTKEIAMYTNNGEFVRFFKSAIEASEVIGCTNSGINRACRENANDSGLESTRYGGVYAGFRWFYVDEDGKILNNNTGSKKNKRDVRIKKCDLNGDELSEYAKIKDAANYNGLSVSGLNSTLRQKDRAIYKGFLWVRA